MYTKGEWKAEGVSVMVDIVFGGKVMPSMVARVFDPDNHQTINDVGIANAHLISSAPDMYEALKEIDSQIRITDKAFGYGIFIRELHWLEYKKALSKAEGK